MTKREDIEAAALRRIEQINELKQFEETASKIISRHNGDIDPRDLRDATYMAIAKRFFLYFCGMTAEMQNEVLVMLLDRHCPNSAGEIYDGMA
jgi:hypothetical protein